MSVQWAGRVIEYCHHYPLAISSWTYLFSPPSFRTFNVHVKFYGLRCVTVKRFYSTHFQPSNFNHRHLWSRFTSNITQKAWNYSGTTKIESHEGSSSEWADLTEMFFVVEFPEACQWAELVARECTQVLLPMFLTFSLFPVNDSNTPNSSIHVGATIRCITWKKMSWWTRLRLEVCLENPVVINVYYYGWCWTQQMFFYLTACE